MSSNDFSAVDEKTLYSLHARLQQQQDNICEEISRLKEVAWESNTILKEIEKEITRCTIPRNCRGTYNNALHCCSHCRQQQQCITETGTK